MRGRWTRGTLSFQSFARGLSAITGLTAWPACACAPTSVPRAAGSQCAAAMPKRTRRSASCRRRPAEGIPNCQCCTWYSTEIAVNDSPSRRSVRSSFLFHFQSLITRDQVKIRNAIFRFVLTSPVIELVRNINRSLLTNSLTKLTI